MAMLIHQRLSSLSLLSVVLMISPAAFADKTSEEIEALLAPSAHPEVLHCTEFGERFDGVAETVTLEQIQALREMMVERRFTELNDALHDMQLAAEKDLSKETVVFSAYNSLAYGLDDYTPHFDAWVAATPFAYQAHLARGVHFNDLSWKARGGGWSRDIEDEQRVRFRSLMEEAVDSLESSLNLNLNVSTTVAVLVESLKVIGRRERLNEMMGFADAEMPDSFIVNREIVGALSILWGGSAEEIGRFLQKRLERSTRLENTLSLRGYYWRALGARNRSDETLSGRYFRRATYCGEDSLLWRAFAFHLRTTLWADNAIRYLNKALTADPVSFSNHTALAREHVVANDLESARYHYDIASQIDPSLPTRLSWDGFVVYSRHAAAKIYIHREEPFRAIQLLEPALDIDPDNQAVLVSYATALRQKRELSTARVVIDSILSEDPLHYPAVLESMNLLFWQNLHDEAMATLSEYIEHVPDNANARFQRGRLEYLENKNYRAAWPDLRMGCENGESEACEYLQKMIRDIIETPMPELYDLFPVPVAPQASDPLNQ